MSTLALFSIKGGVGKTTAAVNLAYVSASEGAKTLLWDLDPQAAASYCLGFDDVNETNNLRLVSTIAEPESSIRGTAFENLDLLPVDAPLPGMDDAAASADLTSAKMAEALGSLSRSYDHIFVDCPAGLTPIGESVIDTADALIVPTIPTALSTRTLSKLHAHLEGRHRHRMVLPFLSMVDRRRKLHRDVSRDTATDPSFLAVWVPYASPVERVGVRRGPIGSFARMTAPARAYELMWSEIEGRLSGEHISTKLKTEEAPRSGFVAMSPNAGAV